MKEQLQSILGFALSVVILLALTTIVLLFVVGAEWLSVRVLPVLNQAAFFAAPICIFVLVPLGFIRATRVLAGYGLYLCSYIFGLRLWMTGLLVTLALWGRIAVIIGLLLAGVGVVPIAFIASLFKGEWLTFANLGSL